MLAAYRVRSDTAVNLPYLADKGNTSRGGDTQEEGEQGQGEVQGPVGEQGGKINRQGARRIYVKASRAKYQE